MTIKTSILTIGTELLVGHTLNTHAKYLTKALNTLGYSVINHLTCGDNFERISIALHYLASHSACIIVTGGLGPTQDDITRDAIADFLELPNVENREAQKKLEQLFKNRTQPMPQNNYRQIFFPQGSKRLINQLGSADGFYIEKNTLKIAVLPGPPLEMRHVFENSLVPILSKSAKLYNRFINLYGLGESMVDARISDLFASQSDPTIGIYANDGYVTLRLSTLKGNKKDAFTTFHPITKNIKQRLDDYVFSYDGASIEQVVVETLMKKKLMISCAESCTGGSLAQAITSISGASKIMKSSYITYANDEKVRILGVLESTLQKYGAVSKETAEEMAIGLYRQTKADISVAITGIAGPTGGSVKKPVGLVYTCVYYNDKAYTKKHIFKSNDRNRIRRHATLSVLMQVLKRLNDFQ